MIVDTSAILAVILDEPEAESFTRAILAAARPMISAATYVEVHAVLARYRRPELRRLLDRQLGALGIDVVPVTVEQARVAAAAYFDYGRGSGHPAQLNFGDVFAYALATETDRALLFKGDDFIHTDIRQADT